MDQKIFEQFNNIKAGFTEKPDKSNLRRDEMVLKAASSGRFVVRPLLVHGKRIVKIDKAMLKAPYVEIADCDGTVTDLAGVVLTSTHGDCIPVYAYDPVKKVIGLVHAGWKGTALGIAGCLIDSMRDEYGCRPKDIYAYIGPGIDKCHFEFGRAEAEEYFYSENPETKEYEYPHPSDPCKVLLDLKGINRYFLMQRGVMNIDISAECTYCNEAKYYSYRRSKDTGRMLAYIERIL